MPLLTESELERTEDTEITLSTGKMLGLFFALVALCAVFFGMGYKVGKNSGHLALNELPATPPGNGIRPTAVKPASQSTTPDLTFYKTVEQNNANPQLSAPQNPAIPADGSAQAAGSATAPPQNSGPNDPAAVSPGNSYYVQVAAVSKQEDADALVDALKKKQYPAFSSNNQGDSYFHVQIGPYGDIKQAEDMRSKLVNDGYNPILKK
jgi:DedD protein